MICPRCEEFKKMLLVEKYIVISEPKKAIFLEKFFDELSTKQSVKSKCKNCGEVISNNELYFDEHDKFTRKLDVFIGEELTSKIEACEFCSYPSEISASMRHGGWFETEDNVDDMIEHFDTAIDVEEFIYNQFGLEYDDIIAKSMHCPNCKNGSGVDYDEKIDYQKFNEFSKIHTKDTLDEFDKRFYGVGSEEVNLLADELTIEELVELKNEYIKNKLYISRSKNFLKLEKKIKTFYEDGIIYTLACGRTIFRTRTMDLGYQIDNLYSDKELWEPPYGVSSHGRYNDIGVSVLYCANNVDVLKKEVDLPNGREYIYAKFIVNKPLKMFPINYIFNKGKDEYSDFDGLISQLPNIDSKKFRVEYIITNIVAAICNKIGYEGIAYKSTKCSESVNYAFFHCKHDIDIKMVEIFK